jgi:phospholipid-binding lipoprotein MlaA
MKNFLSIFLGLVLTVCLVAAGGCAKSRQSKGPALSDNRQEANSTEEPIFEEYEKELSQKEVTVADPLEGFNRTMFGFNDVLYFWVLKPVTKTYSAIVPQPGRVGVDNFFQNVMTPIPLVNCLLQGKGQAAGIELKRFAINTTVGVLGIGDPALEKYNLKQSEETLAQTLAVYGIGNGCYVVWPVLGPSTLRDTAGFAGDQFLNPITYVKPDGAYWGLTATKVINKGSFHIGDYEALKASSIDPYVAMRNGYIQYMNKQIERTGQQEK